MLFVPNVIWVDKINIMRWTGHAVLMSDLTTAILIEMTEGTRPIRRPWRRKGDNIKMDFREIDFGSVG